ncbi:heavy metal-binding protein [Gemmatimonas groenlandica]|uniref:Heavy metal-binding protein n=1 Tax=Gemmatimonas groenlandica TaxID=2732249 RepID=A0A6M4IPD8_9BACT|nr:heavy metal-binding protein [Gemmatimonas groenlandica]QJR34131.1 heavy metal-binding protein [Gemmatimonas groenlandica]
MPRQRIHVQLDGLVAVHAVRAVWTALGAVPGVLSAEVTMQGAVLEVEGDLDRPALDAALDAAGVSVRSIRVEARVLPIL